MPEASDALEDLVDLAFEHAFDSIEGGDTLIPFAILEQGAERTLRRFGAETYEGGLAEGRRTLKGAAPDRAVLAWDGYITTPEGRFDAIFVEAQDRAGRPFILAVRYGFRRVLLRRRLRLFDEGPVWFEDGEGLIGG